MWLIMTEGNSNSLDNMARSIQSWHRGMLRSSKEEGCMVKGKNGQHKDRKDEKGMVPSSEGVEM